MAAVVVPWSMTAAWCRKQADSCSVSPSAGDTPSGGPQGVRGRLGDHRGEGAVGGPQGVKGRLGTTGVEGAIWGHRG